MVAAGAAIAIVVGGFSMVTKKAAAFENQFLELRQLNLDKTNDELIKLNKNVLKTSFSTGMMAKDTAKAYFDIQSATGKYGAEVDGIVEKTAIFARSTKTNFDSAIQSVGKAINAFGMDAKDMDKFFASSFKTVQVGITTFDQLAATQTDYAGAAAAANQTVDDANKLFAAFTQTSKSVREAGTLTKQTFNDLTRKSTIDGFKKIGVNLFDNAGAMKSLDTVTRELVPKLKTMTDFEFSKFKEAVGGSEGIRALLDRTKASGDSLLQTFDNFDNTKFDIDAAIKNANGDLNIMSSILSNKIDTVLVRIGQKTLPTVVRGVSGMVDMFDGAVNTFDELNSSSELWNDSLSFIYKQSVVGSLVEGFKTISGWVSSITVGTSGLFHKIEHGYRGIKQVISTIGEASAKMFEAIGHAMDRNFGLAVNSLLETKNTLSSISKIDFSGSQSSMAQMLAPSAGGGASPFMLANNGVYDNPAGNLADGGGAVDPTGGINAVSGGGKRERYVTVNVAKVLENLNIHTSEVASELPDIEQMIERSLVRIITGAEISVSNG